MRRRGTPFAGVLYVGLALTSRGPRVIEFNARFGDPETQVVLARLQTPLGQLLLAAADGRLDEVGPLRWSDDHAVTVVLAAAGYPGTPRTGDVIEGLARRSAPSVAGDARRHRARTPTARSSPPAAASSSVVALGADLARRRANGPTPALDAIELDGGAAPHRHRARGRPWRGRPCRACAPADGACGTTVAACGPAKLVAMTP